VGIGLGITPRLRRGVIPVPLTDITIRNVKPGAKPITLFDGEGLYMLVSPTGVSGSG
jgi:hypothetical protein